MAVAIFGPMLQRPTALSRHRRRCADALRQIHQRRSCEELPRFSESLRDTHLWSQWLVRDLDNAFCLLNQRINQTFAVGIERNIEVYPDVATALN